ncbi:serine/threonine protein kinase [Betaproteobacteria bacterium SCN2]|jgi:serine/threonine-protein kinase|nr:serine/threonine protein kinase [Betaproteobacteria bacterium SCN2]
MLNQKKIGRYEVVSVMGQGAMGTVYKASDPVIERTVAIKTINLELSREERAEFEERFYREAKSAGRLNHPNIVTIYDVGETENAAYIAMEYIEGESLRDVLDSGVVLPLKRICQIAVQVANALDYAHANGVVHRDIKPANIMISRSRDAKIMDFGIALIPTGSRTQAGTVLGSPKYMAPEQVAGKPTDGRADIFSLGAMLYEMLTGATPFSGDNLSAIMYKIMNEEPAPPSRLNARVPEVFDRIVARALAKRPEDRYPNAKEFSRALRSEEVLAVLDPAQPPQPAQKNVAVAARQHAETDNDPLDVKTEILLPPPQHRCARRAPAATPAAKTRRHALLLAIPVAALAAYLALKPAAEAPPAAVDAGVQHEAGDTVPEPAAVVPTQAAPAPTQPPPPAPLPAAKESPAAAASAKATLSLAITPWGEVFVDGKMAGISPPLTRLELPPGAHTIEIRNGTFASHRVKVNLAADQDMKIKHKFK